MPRHLGYSRRDAKKLEARRFAAVVRLQNGESTAAVARFFGVSIQSVQRWSRLYRSRGDNGLRRRPKSGGPAPKLVSRKARVARQAAGARTCGAWIRHAGLDHGARHAADLAALPGALFPRSREALSAAWLGVEVAQTHLAPGKTREGRCRVRLEPVAGQGTLNP